MLDNQPVDTQEIVPVRQIKSKKSLSKTTPSDSQTKLVQDAISIGGLNRRQAKFVFYYRSGSSCRRAALEAGFSEPTANSASIVLLKNPKIDAEIKRQDFENEVLNEITPEEITRRLIAYSRATPTDYFEFDEKGKLVLKPEGISREQWNCVKGICFDQNELPQLDLHDQMVATMNLARLKGMGKPGIDIHGKLNGDESQPITIQYIDSLVQQYQQTTTINNVQRNLPEPPIEGEILT